MMFVELMSKYKTIHKRKEESEQRQFVDFHFHFHLQCTQCYGELWWIKYWSF